MRRLRTGAAALMLVLSAAVSLLGGSPAAAADTDATAPRSSTGQRWALKVKDAVENKWYFVAAELSDSLSSAQKGKLRARTPYDPASPTLPVGSWETFTLHTADDGTTVSLRNERNGLYVATEIDYADPQQYMLRARSARIGTSASAWEKFVLTADREEPDAFNLRSVAANAYVRAKFSQSGDPGLLLANAASPAGSWERIRLVPVPLPATGEYGYGAEPPAAAAGPAGTVRDVVSWNACSNDNSACPLDNAEVGTVADTVGDRARNAAADVMFVQEFCEKAAAPLESGLEQRAVGGSSSWSVRFAPIYRKLKATGFPAQKHCANSATGADRGAYGTAVAVPGENVWYRSWTLPSRDTAEQRPLLCATVPSQGTAYCGGHFSAGITGDDVYQAGANEHPTGYYRNLQARTAVEQATMLRGRGYQVVLGGDLNASPPDAPQGPGTAPAWVLEPLYFQAGTADAGFEECDQSANGGLRTGAPTHVSSGSSLKLDYVLGPTSADYSCSVTDTGLSDHRLIRATVAFH
ncbi:endonuclease/exonuclease/phosphatase family protein [Streptomyces sp. NPDC057411]|uniref:fascin domain-containing protein n=1 Tax=unclassified Streptomyces TaxID=2593676 RepID=UPI00363B5121